MYYLYERTGVGTSGPVCYRRCMPRVRTLTALLASQPEEDLVEMRDGIRSEIERLQTELSFVEEALNRKPRRGSRTGPRKTTARRQIGLPREELFRLIAALGRPVTAPEVRDMLAERGIEMRTEAVRTGMLRLVEKDKKLVRVGEGRYAVRKENGADTPLSRVGQSQSQEARS
jgi:hypothetical protein